MRYLVLGTGAVGGMIGAQLTSAGIDVTFLDRDEVADQIRSNGLHVLGGSSAIHLAQPNILTELDQLPDDHNIDAIVLAVKAYDAGAAGRMLAQHWKTPPAVISIANGIGVEEALKASLGQDTVIAATLTSAVQKIDVGVLRIEKPRGIGFASQHPLAKAVASEWNRAGLRTNLYPNPQRMKWSKLLTNLISNATSAITRLPAGKVFQHPALFRLELEALREAVRVMDALGFKPHNLPGVPVRMLSEVIFLPAGLIQPILRRLVASGRGEKWPSLYYDLGRGRSEVGWLNGAVVKFGRQHGVPTPANAVLTDVLTPLVQGKLDPNNYQNSPELLVEEARRYEVPGL
jgi:2-dehydropantoate 2-reductase